MKIKVRKYKFIPVMTIILFVLSLTVMVSLGVSSVIIKDRNNPNNIISYEGVIKSIDYNLDSKYTVITLNEYEYLFKVNNNDLSNLNVGSNARIIFSKKTLNYDKVIVRMLYVDDILVVDRSNVDNENIEIMIGIIIVF